MITVCVLLSTYNGEKYLEEQLNSLIKQENVDTTILVRDDGSSDNTTRILDKWQDNGLLKWYSGKNMGYAMSFMDLVKEAGTYDYYAFCDQDDIWLPGKLAAAVECLSKQQYPIKLYCSNLYYYKNGENFGLIKKHTPKFNIHTSLVQNIAAGCTMVFNYELKKLLSRDIPQYLIAHDFWVYQTAMIFGNVFYDDRSYIYYRQHSNNQIGAKTSTYEIWKRRINKFFSKKADGRALQAKELLRCFSHNINDEAIKSIAIVANYKHNIFSRIKLLLDGRYTMGKISNDVLLRFRILLGKL